MQTVASVFFLHQFLFACCQTSFSCALCTAAHVALSLQSPSFSGSVYGCFSPSGVLLVFCIISLTVCEFRECVNHDLTVMRTAVASSVGSRGAKSAVLCSAVGLMEAAVVDGGDASSSLLGFFVLMSWVHPERGG